MNYPDPDTYRRATFELDTSDPFEASVARLVELNRRKRADYALDVDPWSNFRQTSAVMLWGNPVRSVLFNIAQKIVRLVALDANGRGPANESVADTWDDIAVYSVIGGILAREPEKPPRPRSHSNADHEGPDGGDWMANFSPPLNEGHECGPAC